MKVLPISILNKKVSGGGVPPFFPPSEGDLIILNGQTVTFTAPITKTYTSIDIQSGGTLNITGDGNLAQILCSGSFNIDGNIICRATERNGYSYSGTTISGLPYSHTVTQRIGGTGGNGGNSAVPSTRGIGGSGTNGYGGGGGGGGVTLNEITVAKGGNGGSNNSSGATGGVVNIGATPAVGGAGGGGNVTNANGGGGANGLANPPRGGAGGSGGGSGGGPSDRQTRARQRGALGNRGVRLCRHLLLRCTVSADRHRRG